MVTFEYLRYKNMLASGNYWTKISFDNTLNTLIIGGNGSGKSTFLDALCFVLFGKSFRSINKPNLLNSINQKDCMAEVEFSTNGIKYKVIRGMKPNLFEIYKNGELLNKDASNKDYQFILERNILKFNFKSFTQIVIIGSASFTPFMKLKPADRREVIEDLLDINIFSTMNAVVKQKLGDNKNFISDIRNKIELSQQKYDIEKKHIDSLVQNNKDKIIQHKKDIDSYNETIEETQNTIDSLLEEVSSHQDQIGDKSAVENRLKKLENLDYSIDNNLQQKKKYKSFYSQNDLCPTCGQHIDEKFKSDRLTTISKEIDEINSGYEKLQERLELERKALADIKLRQKVIHNLQVTISSHNSTISETKKYITRIQKAIDDLSNQEKEIKDDRELKIIQGELDDLNLQLKDLIYKRSCYEVSSSLLKDSGVKTKIIKQYLPVINKYVNYYLDALDFFVNFNLDETFKETIKSRHRDDFSYFNFSEGEKTKINLALLFAWREVAKIKNSTHTNILILDEVFDSSLDDEGVECLLKILHTMEKINIHVISHKGEIMMDRFDKIVKFEKVKNFSKMKHL